MTVQYGIDVSNHQPNFDFAQAKREGYAFAVHKVSEGAGFADPYWQRARAQMLRHFPGRCGGYVFCRVGASPKQEADKLEGVFGDKADMRLMVDYEDMGEDGRALGSAADLEARVAEYRGRGFKLLPVYLPRWYWQRMGSPDLGFLKGLGVWNSRYVDGAGYGSLLYEGVRPDWWNPLGAAPVRVLQFSSKGQVAGRSIDVNAARSEAELAAIFGTEPAAPLIGPLDLAQQHVVLDGAQQLAAPHVGGPGTVGPRPLRRPERHNVAGNDPATQQAWSRAMVMDLWNEVVFDGYPVEKVAAEFDEAGASPVEILAAVYVTLKEVKEMLVEIKQGVRA